MDSLECIYNFLTAGIFALFCLVCILVNKGSLFYGDGDGKTHCTCKQEEFIGEITPSNNFIIREPGKPPRKVPLYEFLQGTDVEPSASCEKCCTGINTDLEDSEDVEHTFRIRVKLPEGTLEAGDVKKTVVHETSSGTKIAITGPISPAVPVYSSPQPVHAQTYKDADKPPLFEMSKKVDIMYVAVNNTPDTVIPYVYAKECTFSCNADKERTRRSYEPYDRYTDRKAETQHSPEDYVKDNVCSAACTGIRRTHKKHEIYCCIPKPTSEGRDNVDHNRHGHKRRDSARSRRPNDNRYDKNVESNSSLPPMESIHTVSEESKVNDIEPNMNCPDFIDTTPRSRETEIPDKIRRDVDPADRNRNRPSHGHKRGDSARGRRPNDNRYGKNIESDSSLPPVEIEHTVLEESKKNYIEPNVNRRDIIDTTSKPRETDIPDKIGGDDVEPADKNSNRPKGKDSARGRRCNGNRNDKNVEPYPSLPPAETRNTVPEESNENDISNMHLSDVIDITPKPRETDIQVSYLLNSSPATHPYSSRPLNESSNIVPEESKENDIKPNMKNPYLTGTTSRPKKTDIPDDYHLNFGSNTKLSKRILATYRYLSRPPIESRNTVPEESKGNDIKPNINDTTSKPCETDIHNKNHLNSSPNTELSKRVPYSSRLPVSSRNTVPEGSKEDYKKPNMKRPYFIVTTPRPRETDSPDDGLSNSTCNTELSKRARVTDHRFNDNVESFVPRRKYRGITEAQCSKTVTDDHNKRINRSNDNKKKIDSSYCNPLPGKYETDLYYCCFERDETRRLYGKMRVDPDDSLDDSKSTLQGRRTPSSYKHKISGMSSKKDNSVCGQSDDTVFIYDKNTAEYKVFDKNLIPLSTYGPESCSISEKTDVPICVSIAEDSVHKSKIYTQNSPGDDSPNDENIEKQYEKLFGTKHKPQVIPCKEQCDYESSSNIDQRNSSPLKRPYQCPPNDDKESLYDKNENIEKQYEKEFGRQHRKSEHRGRFIDDEEYSVPDNKDMQPRPVTSQTFKTKVSHVEMFVDGIKVKFPHVAEDESPTRVAKESGTRPCGTTSTSPHAHSGGRRPRGQRNADNVSHAPQLKLTLPQRGSSTGKEDNINVTSSCTDICILINDHNIRLHKKYGSSLNNNRRVFEKSVSLSSIDQACISNVSGSENTISNRGSFPSEEVLMTDFRLKKRDDAITSLFIKYGSPADIARATTEANTPNNLESTSSDVNHIYSEMGIPDSFDKEFRKDILDVNRIDTKISPSANKNPNCKHSPMTKHVKKIETGTKEPIPGKTSDIAQTSDVIEYKPLKQKPTNHKPLELKPTDKKSLDNDKKEEQLTGVKEYEINESTLGKHSNNAQNNTTYNKRNFRFKIIYVKNKKYLATNSVNKFKKRISGISTRMKNGCSNNNKEIACKCCTTILKLFKRGTIQVLENIIAESKKSNRDKTSAIAEKNINQTETYDDMKFGSKESSTLLHKKDRKEINLTSDKISEAKEFTNKEILDQLIGEIYSYDDLNKTTKEQNAPQLSQNVAFVLPAAEVHFLSKNEPFVKQLVEETISSVALPSLDESKPSATNKFDVNSKNDLIVESYIYDENIIPERLLAKKEDTSFKNIRQNDEPEIIIQSALVIEEVTHEDEHLHQNKLPLNSQHVCFNRKVKGINDSIASDELILFDLKKWKDNSHSLKNKIGKDDANWYKKKCSYTSRQNVSVFVDPFDDEKSISSGESNESKISQPIPGCTINLFEDNISSNPCCQGYLSLESSETRTPLYSTPCQNKEFYHPQEQDEDSLLLNSKEIRPQQLSDKFDPSETLSDFDRRNYPGGKEEGPQSYNTCCQIFSYSGHSEKSIPVYDLSDDSLKLRQLRYQKAETENRESNNRIELNVSVYSHDLNSVSIPLEDVANYGHKKNLQLCFNKKDENAKNYSEVTDIALWSSNKLKDEPLSDAMDSEESSHTKDASNYDCIQPCSKILCRQSTGDTALANACPTAKIDILSKDTIESFEPYSKECNTTDELPDSNYRMTPDKLREGSRPDSKTPLFDSSCICNSSYSNPSCLEKCAESNAVRLKKSYSLKTKGAQIYSKERNHSRSEELALYTKHPCPPQDKTTEDKYPSHLYHEDFVSLDDSSNTTKSYPRKESQSYSDDSGFISYYQKKYLHSPQDKTLNDPLQTFPKNAVPSNEAYGYDSIKNYELKETFEQPHHLCSGELFIPYYNKGPSCEESCLYSTKPSQNIYLHCPTYRTSNERTIQRKRRLLHEDFDESGMASCFQNKRPRRSQDKTTNIDPIREKRDVSFERKVKNTRLDCKKYNPSDSIHTGRHLHQADEQTRSISESSIYVYPRKYLYRSRNEPLYCYDKEIIASNEKVSTGFDDISDCICSKIQPEEKKRKEKLPSSKSPICVCSNVNLRRSRHKSFYLMDNERIYSDEKVSNESISSNENSNKKSKKVFVSRSHDSKPKFYPHGYDVEPFPYYRYYTPLNEVSLSDKVDSLNEAHPKVRKYLSLEKVAFRRAYEDKSGGPKFQSENKRREGLPGYQFSGNYTKGDAILFTRKRCCPPNKDEEYEKQEITKASMLAGISKKVCILCDREIADSKVNGSRKCTICAKALQDTMIQSSYEKYMQCYKDKYNVSDNKLEAQTEIVKTSRKSRIRSKSPEESFKTDKTSSNVRVISRGKPTIQNVNNKEKINLRTRSNSCSPLTSNVISRRRTNNDDQQVPSIVPSSSRIHTSTKFSSDKQYTYKISPNLTLTLKGETNIENISDNDQMPSKPLCAIRIDKETLTKSARQDSSAIQKRPAQSSKTLINTLTTPTISDEDSNTTIIPNGSRKLINDTLSSQTFSTPSSGNRSCPASATNVRGRFSSSMSEDLFKYQASVEKYNYNRRLCNRMEALRHSHTANNILKNFSDRASTSRSSEYGQFYPYKLQSTRRPCNQPYTQQTVVSTASYPSSRPFTCRLRQHRYNSPPVPPDYNSFAQVEPVNNPCVKSIYRRDTEKNCHQHRHDYY